MANIPIPENDDSLELNVRYQPDMVLEGMLDATVPEMKYLRLSQGNDTYDLLGAQSGDQILELLSEDLTAADEGKVLTATYGGLEGEETASVMWASPLPFIGEGDAGKVLTVNAGETGAEWEEPSGGGGNVLSLSTTVNNAILQAIQGALAKILTSQSKTVGMWEYQYVSGYAAADDFEQVSTAYADFTEGIPCYATLAGATATINAMARDSNNGLITGSFILPQYSYSSHAFMLNISLGINDRGESEPAAERYTLSIEVFAQLIHIFSQS